MKFYFLNTCISCPEQYDVYRDNGELCAYIRLRYGILRVDYPNIDGKMIYVKHFGDDFKGSFDSDEERTKYLKEISIVLKNKILEGISNNIDDNECFYEIVNQSQLEEVLKNV